MINIMLPKICSRASWHSTDATLSHRFLANAAPTAEKAIYFWKIAAAFEGQVMFLSKEGLLRQFFLFVTDSIKKDEATRK